MIYCRHVACLVDNTLLSLGGFKSKWDDLVNIEPEWFSSAQWRSLSIEWVQSGGLLLLLQLLNVGINSHLCLLMRTCFNHTEAVQSGCEPRKRQNKSTNWTRAALSSGLNEDQQHLLVYNLISLSVFHFLFSFSFNTLCSCILKKPSSLIHSVISSFAFHWRSNIIWLQARIMSSVLHPLTLWVLMTYQSESILLTLLNECIVSVTW